VDIFCSSTTARAGTIVESSCYFGRNEALEYRDIELYALRDSEYPGRVKLGMLVQLRLLKGRRNRGNPSVSQPRWINLTTDESSLDLRSNLPSAGTLQASISLKSSWDSRSGTRPLPANGSAIPGTSGQSPSLTVFSPCRLSGLRSRKTSLYSVAPSVIRRGRSTLYPP
jgi:hypothetical protein